MINDIILCGSGKNRGGLGFRRRRQPDLGKVTAFWPLNSSVKCFCLYVCFVVVRVNSDIVFKSFLRTRRHTVK